MANSPERDWIVQVLAPAGPCCRLTGGLAARCYGATRPLRDIDFYVRAGRLEEITSRAEAHVGFGPQYSDRKTSRWRNADVNFAASVQQEICGVTVPVRPSEQLIRYKKRLNRPVDRRDMRQTQRARQAT